MDMHKSSKRIAGTYQKNGKRAFDYSYISKEDADQKAKLKWEQKYGSHSQPSNQNREVETVHDLAVTLYLPTIKNRAINTFHGYWRDSYKRHIEEAIGPLPFGELRKFHIVSFLNTLPSYPARMKAKIVLRCIVQESIENGVPMNITPEAIRGINIGKKPPRATLRIANSDVKRAAAICPPDMVLPLYIVTTLGIRKGELIAIKNSSLDREKMMLHIDRQRLKNGTLALPKGGRSRSIEVSPDFIAMVDAHADLDSEWMMTHGEEPWSHSAIGREWRKLGFEKGVGPHQLRHLAATYFANNVGLLQAQKVLGHAHATTTDSYTHVEGVNTKEAVRLSTKQWESVVNSKN